MSQGGLQKGLLKRKNRSNEQINHLVSQGANIENTPDSSKD